MILMLYYYLKKVAKKEIKITNKIMKAKMIMIMMTKIREIII